MNEKQIQFAQEAAERVRRDYETGKKKKEKKSGGFGSLLLLFLLYAGYSLLRNPSFLKTIQPLRVKLLTLLLGFSLKMHLPYKTVLTGARILGIGLLVLIAVLIAAAVSKKKKKEKGEDAPVFGRVTAAVRRADPRSGSFTKPDAYCAVHDHSAEDHLAYDKAQRIAQLDEWLKSGLIDREEYRVMKDRYQRDL